MESRTSGHRRGLFMVLEGIDGSGKTSLARQVSADLDDIGVVYCSHKEIPVRGDIVDQSMKDVARLLWPGGNILLDAVLTSDYWLHLQSIWHILFSEFVVAPRLSGGETLLVDGWYYKFMAHLLVCGFDRDFLEASFAAAGQPDVVIMLDPDVEVVWNRGRNFRDAELGIHCGYSELGRASFIDYQSKVRTTMQKMAAENGWPVVSVTPECSLLDCARMVEARVRDVMDSATSAETPSRHGLRA